MTLSSFVCVILLQGLLVAAIPTSDGGGEGDPGVVIELPVSGEAEFHGPAQATGSVTIVGHFPCQDPELPATLNPISQIVPQTVETENAHTDGDPGVVMELPVSDETEFVGHVPCNDPEPPATLNPISQIVPQTVETENAHTDGDTGEVMELPVSGETEFHGTAQATGSVTIVGHTPCNDPELPATVETENAPTFTEFDENSPSKVQYYDEIKNEQIRKKVILGAILADSMAEKSAEIDAKLAELDAEIGTIGPIIRSALTNADTSEIDTCVESALLNMESQINSALTKLDEIVDSELSKTEELVESVIRNVEAETEDNRIARISESADKVKLELSTLESFVESILDKSERLVESELEKVNALVESEMEKIDSIIESQLDKLDLFIEKELEKTDALVKTEMLKMESLVENEMAKVEKSMEDMADYSNAVSNDEPVFSPVVEDVEDGCKIKLPIVGKAVFNGVVPATGTCKIMADFPCPVMYHKEHLPVVEILRNRQKPMGVTVSGDVELADVAGSTSFCVHFPCPPLKATEVGPDGKKYIWIKKSSKKCDLENTCSD